MKNSCTSPFIYMYNDYRKLIRDLFKYQKQKNRRFTYRAFSLKAGLSSPSALKDVSEGKKNLSSKSAIQFATGFSLNKKESEFFITLVNFNQSKTELEKNKFYKELLKLKQVQKHLLLTSDQYEYYSNWYNSAIRELVATENFKNDPTYIASRIIPKISINDVIRSIKLLLKLGLLIQNEDGVLKQNSPVLTTDPEISTLSIQNFNRSMINLGGEAIERFSQKEREISGLTIAISKESSIEIKEMIRDFKYKLLNYAANDTRAISEVYQVNFQFFPLSKQGEVAV